MVKATKTIGKQKFEHEFSDTAWDNLGKEKDGWVEVSKSTTKTIAKPEALKAAEEAK